MFERLKAYHSIIVTGPHRTGTTICAEMIGHDTGLPVYREESFDYRNIEKAESLIRKGGVFQGPYLLPWVPIFPAYVVVMERDRNEIEQSVERLRNRGISRPFFTAQQAYMLWSHIGHKVNGEKVRYETLAEHPLWRSDRRGWGHRQTC